MDSLNLNPFPGHLSSADWWTAFVAGRVFLVLSLMAFSALVVCTLLGPGCLEDVPLMKG